MIYIETLGTGEDCAIISLGAVVFNPFTGNQGMCFYQRINWQSNFARGRTCTEDTLKFWFGQSKEALGKVMQPGYDIARVLDMFMEWDPKGYEPWGNSARFDRGIIAHAIRTITEKPLPWNWWA
jgi:hypothetical protein